MTLTLDRRRADARDHRLAPVVPALAGGGDGAGPAVVRARLDAAPRRRTGCRPGERVAPPAGPWDDAFTDLAADPVLEWPGQLRLDGLVDAAPGGSSTRCPRRRCAWSRSRARRTPLNGSPEVVRAGGAADPRDALAVDPPGLSSARRRCDPGISSGGSSTRIDAAPGPHRALEVDPRERRLAHRDDGHADELARAPREKSGSWPTRHGRSAGRRPPRSPRPRPRPARHASRGSTTTCAPSAVGHDPRRLVGPHLGRRDEQVRRRRRCPRAPAQPLGLPAALLGQGPEASSPVNFSGSPACAWRSRYRVVIGHLARRVAPTRPHGLRSSTSPDARNTMSSAMFVTRSPIRSR